MNERLLQALKISVEYGITSASLLQRKMLIPYGHAIELLRVMEKREYIRPISADSKGYTTLTTWADIERMKKGG